MAVTLPAVVEATGVTRDFQSGSAVIHALRGVDLAIRPGELAALRGRSGSGKTTLLNILVGLDSPTSGRVTLMGHDLAGLSEVGRTKLRREYVGMMFQNAHLFPSLTAQENVEIPLRLAQTPVAESVRRAADGLAMVGLAERRRHRGNELSGGEQQRVALARALVSAPQVVVADEPTGNLDSLTGRAIIDMLRAIAHERHIGFLVATHDNHVLASADRVLRIQDGLLTVE